MTPHENDCPRAKWPTRAAAGQGGLSVSVCVWCGADFPASTSNNGKVKIFCGTACRFEFNAQACRLGREYLYRMANSNGIPIRDAIPGGIPAPPTSKKDPAV